jgi:hypothetical protein
MQTEEKRKIQAWVPVSIYNQIKSFGFKTQKPFYKESVKRI